MTTADIQRALVALGYNIGNTGPKRNGVDGMLGGRTSAALKAFQASRGLAQTGMPNALTLIALAAPVPVLTTSARPLARIVDPAWMPSARVSRVIAHWTAGTHNASANDRAHYHLLIEADGTLVRGIPTIDLNSEPSAKKGYAAHTLGCNTGSIGVSLCCMGGNDVRENPFNAGRWPMTRVQWDRLAMVIADLCDRYAISVSPQTVLSHAEVQGTLKKPQRGKWDFTRLAFDPSVVGARACGNLLRSNVAALMR